MLVYLEWVSHSKAHFIYYTFLYEKSARNRLENASRYRINADDFNSTTESLFQLIAASETPILKLIFRGYLPCYVYNKNYS